MRGTTGFVRGMRKEEKLSPLVGEEREKGGTQRVTKIFPSSSASSSYSPILPCAPSTHTQGKVTPAPARIVLYSLSGDWLGVRVSRIKAGNVSVCCCFSFLAPSVLSSVFLWELKVVRCRFLLTDRFVPYAIFTSFCFLFCLHNLVCLLVICCCIQTYFCVV